MATYSLVRSFPHLGALACGAKVNWGGRGGGPWLLFKCGPDPLPQYHTNQASLHTHRLYIDGKMQ